MADYWMKLYIEILDDPKMAVMPDRVWRRTIELFLVAKKLNKDGHLPETRQIAWLLRMSPDDLELDMTQIASTGIIVKEIDGWFIPNFIKRQSAVGGAERVSQFRKREQKQEYYEDVTNEKRFVTQNTDYREQNTESDTDKEVVVVGDTASIFRVYEQEIGLLTPAIKEKMLDAETLYPQAWIIDAMKESATKNKRFWGYTEGILKRWKVEGKGNGNGNKYTSSMTTDEKLNIAFAQIAQEKKDAAKDIEMPF
jgi:DnaD/phage-associated family protein